MTLEPLADLIKAIALRRGQFTLASGRDSSYLIDLKPVSMHPRGSVWIADAILKRTVDEGIHVDAFGGMAMGGVPIAAVVCSRSLLCRPIPGFFVRKELKGHGTNRVIEGCLRPACAPS